MDVDTKLVDGTVTAQDAPLGVCLWPVRSPEYAPNFTLASVALTRDSHGSWVTWIYESGKARVFVADEQVMVRVNPDEWPADAALAFTADAPLAISTHPADGVATRPTSTLRPSHVIGRTN